MSAICLWGKTTQAKASYGFRQHSTHKSSQCNFSLARNSRHCTHFWATSINGYIFKENRIIQAEDGCFQRVFKWVNLLPLEHANVFLIHTQEKFSHFLSGMYRKSFFIPKFRGISFASFSTFSILATTAFINASQTLRSHVENYEKSF